MGWIIWGSVPARARDFLFLQNNQPGTGAYPTFYSEGTGTSCLTAYASWGMQITTYPPLMMLRMSSARVAGWSTACNTGTTQTQPHQISNTQWTENKTTDVVTQQHSHKLLMMDILMSETCWAHKKWNKIASDIKLVFHSSTKEIDRYMAWSTTRWLS